MTEAHVFALGLALACLAGVRAYLTVFGVGLAGLMGWVDLPSALAPTMSPWVLGTAGALTIVEFALDKVPGVDSGWDLLQTLARVPAGAFLTAATLSDGGELAAGALALGAGAAFTTHAVKAGSRALINASPEPVSNWTASVGEDVAAVGALALGAGAAFTTHAVKAGSRVLINASPEPMSNWAASLGEDVAALGALALVFAYPWWALALLLAVLGTIALVVWLLARWVWRRLRPSPAVATR